ncbi:MAG: putative 2OG-Fe(II) oxygenase, partial [Novosphingobium sp.]
LLVDRPGWSEGQAWLARSRWMSGDPAPLRDLDAALLRQPSAGELWRLRIMLAMQAGDFAEALAVLDRADAAIGPAPLWLAHRAACLDELGRTRAAAAAFAALGPPGEVGSAVRLARHLLRRGEAKGAAAALERWLGGDDARHVWPYLALAWRLAGDRRAAWLDGDPRLTGVYDLAPDDVAAIAGRLRGLHTARRQPIDQSLRGGTQTGGYLFARLEPEYRALRRAVVAAVEAHVAALPPRDPFHPVLRMRRDAPVRFSGAWSVRLGDGGYHASHVHPAGWFSSALYLAVPEGEPGDLVLGQPEPELGLDLPPLRTIAPRPGRLVLFPSMLWHGTRPFAAGERLTVAFDVAPPP